jgi:hypothetical protein
MRTTVFDTPILHTVMRCAAIMLMKACGWKAVGTLPAADKYVSIAAPHTTNWDFVWTICISLKLRVKVFWMGKHTLFKGPAGPIMRWLGGIPIDRTQSGNTVEQSIAAFNDNEKLIMIIPPEGTRSKTRYWKTGFYHIAHGAGVPIAMGFLDFKLKIGGFGPAFIPTGDIEADMELIKGFYSNISGKFPDQYGETQLFSNSTIDANTKAYTGDVSVFFTPTGDVESDLHFLATYYSAITAPARNCTKLCA